MPTLDSADRRVLPSKAALIVFLSMIGAASLVYYDLGAFIPRLHEVRAQNNLDAGYSFGNDFYQIWLAAREWMQQRRDPYSLEMMRDIQIGLYGRPLDSRLHGDPKDRRMFPYPAFTELLFWPAALVPFEIVRVVVCCGLAALTIGTVLLWMQALSWRLEWAWLVTLFLLVFSSHPILEALYADQIGLFVLFLLAASILALSRGKHLLSGVLLAVSTVKPQVTALVIMYLILQCLRDWRVRSRFFVGLAVTTTALVGGALLVWPHWISSWIHVVFQYHDYTGRPLVLEILAILLGSYSGNAAAAMTAALLFAALILAWRNRAASPNSLEFWMTFSLLLGITCILLLPGQAIYDHGVLLPGIFLIALQRRNLYSSWIQKVILFTGLAVLLWPWFASLILIALRPFLTPAQFYSKNVLSLPLRVAVMLPFLVLALLLLVRRTALRGEVIGP